ncbi:PBSX family phage terminase large subunit [Mogibacterium kristiansenii]|uniref:PBSX family phage terminase large subunit n=1 Tax=Mogibacterium kristiansenii TaxID=2606708 RepID=A0A6N7XL45_9FIRM|nr:PBSX family phage terminase large subunit [Mogibacterium kristiansenii]MST70656.1 PBSX family phage terminase large subunit [Mogibacterium kristiansenii]
MNIEVQANPCFKEVDNSKKRYIVMKGSAGSGKSVDTAQNYILRLMQDKGRNLVAMRKSDITNRDSTFAELTGAVYRMFGDKSDLYWKINRSPQMLTCRSNGNQIIFRGMNDDRQREKLKSITFPKGKLTDVWLEEATEFTQADLEIIDDRLRGELPEGQFYQIRMTFNPVNKNHWIKKVFFDIPDPNVLTHHSTYLTNRFIDDAYKQRMERRKKVDPEGYQIYGLGEWGEIGGLILHNWEPQDISQNINDYDDFAIGQDFGFNHANAILLLGWKDGDIYILRELYGFEKDTAEWIAEANNAGVPKNRVMWCDSAEPDRIKMWKDAGYRAKGVNKGGSAGSVKAQIEWLKGSTDPNDKSKVIGRKIYVHPSCTNTIKELQQWKWKRDDRTGEYLDQPVPFQDDAMAALRYGVEGWRKMKRWTI